MRACNNIESKKSTVVCLRYVYGSHIQLQIKYNKSHIFNKYVECIIQRSLKPLYTLCFACYDKEHAYVYSKINVANNFAGDSCIISYEGIIKR